jgi:uncharacterized protein (DUF2141 family)
MSKFIFAALIGLISSTLASVDGSKTNRPVEVLIKVDNLKPTSSNLMVAVFREEDKFLGDTPYLTRKLSLKDRQENARVSLEIKSGTYAIAIYQDLNKNGKLDRNMFQFPSEPYGFSNNFHPRFGPPKWKDASMELGEGEEISISMIR